MADRLSALDATFLEIEQMDEGATMHIGGVMVFDPPPAGRAAPSLAELCEDMSARLVSLPRYSQRLSQERTGGLAWPQWEPDGRYHIHNHVGRATLPAPGGDAELTAWSADFFSHRLDRTRPLWEMVLVDGLEQGRWALATKTHHCLVDGVGSVSVGGTTCWAPAAGWIGGSIGAGVIVEGVGGTIGAGAGVAAAVSCA